MNRRNLAPDAIWSPNLGKCAKLALVYSLNEKNTKPYILRNARVYRTVSNEVLCKINGITPIHIKIYELGRVNEFAQGI